MPKQESQKKDSFIYVRCTHEEKQIARAVATKDHRNLSEMVIHLILKEAQSGK